MRPQAESKELSPERRAEVQALAGQFRELQDRYKEEARKKAHQEFEKETRKTDHH